MNEKDTVYATYDPDRFGTIVRLGPEVSEVRWHDGGRETFFISNNHLKVKDERDGNRPHASGRKRRN